MADDEPFIGYDEHGNPVERSDPPRVGPFMGYDERGNPRKLANRPPASYRPRRRTILLALLVVGAVVSGWIALRDNGLLGGLDHDGPLVLKGGNNGAVCTYAAYQDALDRLQNASGDTVHIDRIAPTVVGGPREMSLGEVYTFKSTQSGGRAPQPSEGLAPVGAYRLIDPRRPDRTDIAPHGDRGVSYVVTLLDGAYPRRPGVSTVIGIRDIVVDYHVGARHFRESGGTETKFECPYGAERRRATRGA
jgi:hypothetical protein